MSRVFVGGRFDAEEGRAGEARATDTVAGLSVCVKVEGGPRSPETLTGPVVKSRRKHAPNLILGGALVGAWRKMWSVVRARLSQGWAVQREG